MKILKTTVTKKVIVCFFNLSEENLKVAAFVIFPTSLMVLFEIHPKSQGSLFERIARFL